MNALIPYLIFNGTCELALRFYAKLFEGEIVHLQRFQDAPIETPAEAADRIFDAELRTKNMIIKASDAMPGQDVNVGNHISLFLTFSSQETQREVYSQLAAEGQIAFELTTQSNFAMVTDKFGISWMLAFEKSK